MYREANQSSQFVSHPLLREKTVEFREYQNNISKSAFHKNTLVILPTALGKTVISLLVCANTLYHHRDKRVLILAPTRPLVMQHMGSFFSIMKILESQVAILTGKITPIERRAVWNNPEIRLVFATPEVVKNDIAENRLSLKDFTLLIVDEAHRAVKDYAYTSVAKEYVKQSVYPIILALTASPGSQKQRVQEVCDNLFIEHVEYRGEDDIDVKSYINPIEVNWKWFDLSSEYQYIRTTLKSMLDERIKWLIHRRLIRKDPNWIFKRDLINVGEQLRYNLELTMDENRAPLYVALKHQASALSLMYCAELIESQGSYSLEAFLNRIEVEGSKTHQSLLNDPRIKEIRTLVNNLSTEHPKLKYIVDVLKNKFGSHDFNPIERNGNRGNDDRRTIHDNLMPNTSRVLIFTQYRDTARHIVKVLSKHGIRASRFVGQAKRQGDAGMTQEEQSRILESFRSGEFDILVATSIAEEGLDIPEVDLVIFYEPIPSEIRYIQRRGRTGRKTAGSVVILAAKETIDERYLDASKRRFQKMKQALSSLNMTLNPQNRYTLPPETMTANEIELLDLAIRRTDEKLKKEVEKKLLSTNKTYIQNALTPKISGYTGDLIRNRKMSLLTLEEQRLTSHFRRQVDSAARRIHSLLAAKGRSGLDFDSICDQIGIDNTVAIEAINRLDKLKRIKWLDDSTVVLADKLKQISGRTYNIEIEKIIQGRALVVVNDKWHARLNHYDYEGPRELLKKGNEFKVVGELYNIKGILNLRIKQIID
jgi:ERCC4-related helicase